MLSFRTKTGPDAAWKIFCTDNENRYFNVFVKKTLALVKKELFCDFAW